MKQVVSKSIVAHLWPYIQKQQSLQYQKIHSTLKGKNDKNSVTNELDACVYTYTGGLKVRRTGEISATDCGVFAVSGVLIRLHECK